MKFLSFKWRGLESGPKKLALHHMFHVELPDIVLILKTFGEGLIVCIFLESIFPSWNLIVNDVCG